MSPPSRNAPASSIVMNPWAQATIMRAAGSVWRGPVSSATTLRNAAAERTDRAVAPGPESGANMSVYVTGLACANRR
jgi:hypothetical protein